MWIIGLVLLINLAHENVVSAKTFMTNEISMPFDARKKVENDIPTIIWNNQNPQPIPHRIKSSRFERLRGADVQPIQVRPAVVEIPSSAPKIEVVPAAPESSPIVVDVEKSEVLPSKIIEVEVEKEREQPEPRLHEHEASVREVSIHEARQFVAAAPLEEVKPAAESWGSPPIDFASEVVPTEVAEFEEAEIVPTIPDNYAKVPEIETREPIKQIYPISEKSSKFTEVTEEPTTTTKKPKKLKKRKRKNRKTTTTSTTMVTLPITTTVAPTTESTTPSTTTTTTTTTTPLPTTTTTSLPAIQIQTLSKHGESYLGGWNEEMKKSDGSSSLGNIMNQLSEVPSSISLTDDEAVRAYYQKYYEEWYRQHNIAIPTELPSEVVTSATPRKISIQLGPRNQASSSNTAAASNPFGIDSNSTVPTKEQLVKICEYVEKISKSFGIKDPVTFAKNNCAFVKNFHPNATCEQVQEVMEYCSSRVYSAES